MVDIFESISASDKVELKISKLLDTRSIFELIFEIVNRTGFYSLDENFSLIKALNIDSDDENFKDVLYNTWVSMEANLDTSKTQEEFNAKFALFVPIILKKMEAIKSVAI